MEDCPRCVQAWHLMNGLVTGMLISDPRWKPAVAWLNANRPGSVKPDANSERLQWIASHVTAYRQGLYFPILTWVDDQGVEQMSTVDASEIQGATEAEEDLKLFLACVDIARKKKP